MKLINDDCLKVLPTIPDKSVDFIFTDPPYGTISCKWDSIIPLDEMWEQFNRVCKQDDRARVEDRPAAARRHAAHPHHPLDRLKLQVACAYSSR